MKKFFALAAFCVTVAAATMAQPFLRDVMLLQKLQRPDVVVALLDRDATRPAFMSSFLSWVGGYVIDMMKGFTGSHVAAIEKTIGARRELLQAQLNADAAIEAADRYAKAGDKFNIAPERTCRILNEDKETGMAMVMNDINGKALSRRETARLAGSAVPAVAAGEIIKNHADLYCSPEDIERGKCANLSLMPDADTRASTLFQPSAGGTLSSDEALAAKAFIRLVTRPIPIEDVPRALDKTAAGQRFLLEKQQAIAVDSMVAGSLARILAARSPRS